MTSVIAAVRTLFRQRAALGRRVDPGWAVVRMSPGVFAAYRDELRRRVVLWSKEDELCYFGGDLYVYGCRVVRDPCALVLVLDG